MQILLSMLISIVWSQALPTAKALFYAASDVHCGIHYWLEAEDGTRLTEGTAAARQGRFTVHIRENACAGYLTVWNVSNGRELTPRDERVSGGGRWSGYLMSDRAYVVPGSFEFSEGGGPTHLVIVWARSQTEVAHTAPDALARVKDMPRWMSIVRQVDESTPGEIGTYVMNRVNAGLVTELVFRRR